ncbi:hypothetical protein ACWDSD_45225, partial [Streptomyces spiralis]
PPPYGCAGGRALRLFCHGQCSFEGATIPAARGTRDIAAASDGTRRGANAGEPSGIDVITC